MDAQTQWTGLDSQRLARITDHLDRNYISNGKLAGCQIAVARHGHTAYSASLGMMDIERNKPMADDTIFRIYSMTKPITSVALMILYERGYFQLTDPVSRYVPSWKNHRVWVSGEGEDMVTEAPRKPATLRRPRSSTPSGARCAICASRSPTAATCAAPTAWPRRWSSCPRRRC